MIEEIEAAIESLEGIVDSLYLPSGQHAFIKTADGHLSVGHTSSFKKIKEVLISIKKEKQLAWLQDIYIKEHDARQAVVEAAKTFINANPKNMKGVLARWEEFKEALQIFDLTMDKNYTDRAIDLLFDKVDDLLIAGKFSEVDDILRNIDLDRLNIKLMIGVLTITLPASGLLAERKKIFQEIKERLSVLAPDRLEGLLGGLE